MVTSQNLNLGYEKSVVLIERATPEIKEASGTTALASVQLLDLPGGQKYISFSHTHSNVVGRTYSVFSFGGLQRMSMLLHSGQLEVNELSVCQRLIVPQFAGVQAGKVCLGTGAFFIVSVIGTSRTWLFATMILAPNGGNTSIEAVSQKGNGLPSRKVKYNSAKQKIDCND